MALLWGIASAGKISHDFVTALKLLPTEEHRVVAVGARKLDNAKEFATRHNIETAYEGYESLAKNPEIQIVYIGSLNPQHYEIAMLMLDNNKHVLCEKPMCMNYKQAKQLVDLAQKKNLFLMEAIWSRFFPAYVYLRDYIKSGALGKVYRVEASFGVPISHVDRLNTKSLGGGTVLDLGVYTIQFAQMIFGCEPNKVQATGEVNKDGVDASMACLLSYPEGCVASLATHSKVILSNEAVVIGTQGTAKLFNFWCPTKIQLADGTMKEFPLPPEGSYNFTNSAGLNYEAKECRKCILEGKISSSVMPVSESLILAKLEDEIRKQIGVHYPEDD